MGAYRPRLVENGPVPLSASQPGVTLPGTRPNPRAAFQMPPAYKYNRGHVFRDFGQRPPGSGQQQQQPQQQMMSGFTRLSLSGNGKRDASMPGQEYVYGTPTSFPSDQFAGAVPSQYMVPSLNQRPQGVVGNSSVHRSDYPSTQQEFFGGTAYFYPQSSQAVPIYPDSNSYMGPPSHIAHFQSTASGYSTAADLRQDLLYRQSTSQMFLPPEDTRFPQAMERYYALCPLEPIDTSAEPRLGSLGFATTCYKAINSKDNLVYMLRRVHGYRLTGLKTPHLVDQWKKLDVPGVVTLREVFHTKAFKDHSAIFVYDYHAGAETLLSRHFSNSRPPSPQKQRVQNSMPAGSSMVGSTYSLPSGRPNFYSSSSQSLLPEPLLWSYIIQLTGALRTIHEAGLAARVIFPSKILVSGRSRLLLSCAGLLDVLAYENGSSNSATVARHQQDDLMALGQTLLALACNNSMAAIQRENIPKALEAVALNYSSDLKNLILFVSFLTICSLCNLLFICLLSDIFLAVNNLYVLLMK